MDILTPVPTLETAETELLTLLTGHASANEFPFALWRLPHSQIKQLLISNEYQKPASDNVLEDMKPGFIFAPFERGREIFLPADLLFAFELGKLKANSDPATEASISWLEKSLPGMKPKKKFKPANSGTTPPADRKDEEFLSLIRRCMDEVERGTLEKVVPSRTRVIELPEHFDVISAFEKLSAVYPNALVSLVNVPGIGCWLGATPEVLVCIEDKTIFKTVALAGTQPYKDNMNLRNVAWTQKEIEEQALVERYVISCFKKIRLREYEEHGPKTVVAGNLIHLKSDFTVDMKATNFPNLGTTMLDLLHPTSAVCGMPLDAARKFLTANEGYDRGFYSGYLGPVNVNNNIDIFVNIRCMQLLDKKGILYAGAGITVDSIPEQEFEETDMKFNTLLNVII